MIGRGGGNRQPEAGQPMAETHIRLKNLCSYDFGRGGGNRTPVIGFGDRHSTTEPHPHYLNYKFQITNYKQ